MCINHMIWPAHKQKTIFSNFIPVNRILNLKKKEKQNAKKQHFSKNWKRLVERKFIAPQP